MEIGTEDQPGAPRGVLAVLGLVLIVVGAALAAVFVFRLQPPYVPPAVSTTAVQGVANIIMPPGVGASQNLNFSPSNATIVIGVNNTVVWTNDDSAAHTVVSRSLPPGAQPFQSSVLSKGDTFNVTLTVPGVYVYFCSIHPAWMVATLVVKGSASGTTASQASGPTVVIPDGVAANQGLNFSPSTITVVIGVNSTVTWVNKDSGIHTVTATDKSFNSGNLSPGATWSHTFTTSGTFTYFCIYHGWMKGTVVVKPGS